MTANNQSSGRQQRPPQAQRSPGRMPSGQAASDHEPIEQAVPRQSNPATSSASRPAPRMPGVTSSATSPRRSQTSDHQAAQAPPRAAAPSPGRSHTQDRAGRAGGGARRPVKSGMRWPLRMKFMLVMAGVSTAAMLLLGILMSRTTNQYLVGQKQQDGVEVARMAVQLGVLMRAHINQMVKLEVPLTPKDVQDDIQRLLENAKSWGGEVEFSDLESVLFNCPTVPELSGAGIGNDNGTIVDKDSRLSSIFVPKLAKDVRLPEGIEVYEGRKRLPGGEMIRIMRFKISLPKSFGTVENLGRTEPANIRVDIAMASVDKVGTNLMIAIIVSVLIAGGLAVAIAHWMARSITRPLDRLLSDMAIVSKGDLAHRTNATSSDEIGVLADEFNRMTGSLQEAQAAVIEQEKAAYELSLAREVQQQLLPAQPPLITGYQCDSFYQGAKQVSGDYYDFIPLGNGLWGFIIADVSGKGIPGSMVMAVTRTVVRLVALRHGANAADTLKDTNRLIAKQIKRGMFVTSFYAVLDERSGQVTFSSAGHNPMLIYRAATRNCELNTTKGIALGFNEGPLFDKTVEQATLQLGRGDAMILYTDGFPEAMNAKNEEFGEDNFVALAAANGHLESPGLIKSVVNGIAKHRGDAEQSDDLTMLTVRRA
jgi:serine phosphatase RsbU (regulator of sigma subunit)